MATVCGTSLALMDAGVPLKAPVAGIAMGLIKEGDDFAVLSDILGDEDHLGDMDFKVAGTTKGVTSLQMDIKITGITEEIMRVALDQAHDGRLHILGEMAKALTGAREELGEYAPRIETIKIPVDKIREVIGSGGSVIREIVAESGAKIDIEDDGTVKIASANRESIEKALARIRGITSEPEVGQIYKGKVVKIMEFGAFVNFFGCEGRPRAHLAADAGPPGDGRRGREGRPGSLREASGLRRSRQDAAVDEDRRSDDGPGNSACRGRAGGSLRSSSAAPRRRPWRRSWP